MMYVPKAAPSFRRGDGRSAVQWIWLASCLTSWLGLLAGPATAAEKLEYNRDVRPILWETCFRCHGPDSASREADLRLDQRDAAIAMHAIVPGSPDESELIRRIFSTDPDEVMPPPETKKSLTEAQKETLRKWIAQGAEYQLHWSLIPPVRPDLPAVKNAAWVRNPIDAFILAPLEAAGLEPAPEADRRTLARRASLDLTGLPPDPKHVEAFVNNPSPQAYEEYVDELLRSPAWGEHRGRYWLDYARFADTHGIHFDNYREIWPYRDWVIRAFNDNMPFDQFTLVNLAGDLLPNRTLDQQIGSGFNRCNITTNEGGVIAEEYLVLYTRDRTETTSHVWLGLTANCAVCHSHKFDPLSQREFYELAAFFNNTTQGAMDGNIKDTPPIVVVPRGDERGRWDELNQLIPAARSAVEARKAEARPAFDAWLASAQAQELAASIPTEALYLHAPLQEGQGPTAKLQIAGESQELPLAAAAKWTEGVTSAQALEIQGAALEAPQVADFERDQAFTCAAWVKLPANDSGGAICARMDNEQAFRGWDFWVQRRQVGMHIIHAWPENALKVVGKAQLPANTWTHVAVSYDGSGKAAGVKVFYNGKLQETNVEADKLASSIRTEVPFKIGQRNTSEPLSGAGLQDLRIYQRALPGEEVEALANSSRFAAILAKSPADRTDDDKSTVYAWWLPAKDSAYREATARQEQLEQEQKAIQARAGIAHVMQEKPEAPRAFVLNRGEYDQRKDEVTPDTPDVLPAFPAEFPRNRLGFAQWLLLPEHPLTARVTVNRFWLEVFGTGLVRTADDFGVAGELPSHPELLDWLAIEFRETGWDVKRLVRLMVTSAAYRQAALTTPDKLAADPQNRLLSRGPRFRMDAEMIRDHALAASGLLVRKLGGPSVKPYMPPGVWEAVAMIGSNTRDYRRDTGDNLYRRSLYTFWKRSAPPASMDVFNAPSRETCTVQRERTNTPLQALVTLNDEQFIEAARHLAQQALLLPAETSDDERIQFITARLISRPFREEELTVVRASLAALRQYYAEHAEDARQLIAVGESPADPSLDASLLASWTMLTNQLMNLDEVVTK